MIILNFNSYTSFFLYPISLFLATFRFNSKISVFRHVIQASFIFIITFSVYCNHHFTKRSLYELGYGGDRPVQLHIPLDVLCHKYKHLVSDPKMCVGLLILQTQTLTNFDLVLKPIGDELLIKEKCNNDAKSEAVGETKTLRRKCPVHSVRSSEVLLSY